MEGQVAPPLLLTSLTQVPHPVPLAMPCGIVCLVLWYTVPFPPFCVVVPSSSKGRVAASGQHFEQKVIIIL